MSFSSQVKAEVARITGERECCRRSELAALAKFTAVRQAGDPPGEALAWMFFAENAATARKVFVLLRKLYSLEVQLGVQPRDSRKRGHGAYCVRIPPQVGLARWTPPGRSDPGLGDEYGPQMPRCCQRAFLRGAFLAVGSISHPDRGNHMEVVLPREELAGAVKALMEAMEMNPGCNRRKNRDVLYLKEGEQIVRFLSVIGAHGALLEYENVRVRREVRNGLNRVLNCETANVEKTVETGLRQVQKIQLLQQSGQLEKLPPRLQEMARLRLEYPEMSLQELGQNMEPGLSKSGVNHLLRRLESKADAILGEKPVN